MMCSSGVRPATWVSKSARGTPRRAASGHRPATQFGKLAAAARIACAVMSGCPEAPDSPLHCGSEGRETLSCLGRMGLNSARRSKPWEKAGALMAAASAAPVLRTQMKRLAVPIVLLLCGPDRYRYGETNMVAGTLSWQHYPARSNSRQRSGNMLFHPNGPGFSAGPRWQNAAGSDLPSKGIMKAIRKAVFPVAGLGTRFLPATKAAPQEILPVVDLPLIQHVVDEAREAGIEHFIFVTGRNKGVIEDHFDRQFELEHALTERQRQADLELLARAWPGRGPASFPRQRQPVGLGHAVWCARELGGHEPFALLLPDVLVQHNRGCLGQMIDAARHIEHANIIAVEQ